MAERIEYYFQGAYLDFEEITAILYQGTDYEVPVTFDGWFATKNDSRTHYCVHRTIDQNRQLGFITEIEASPTGYPEQFKNREIFAKVTATREFTSDDSYYALQESVLLMGNCSQHFLGVDGRKGLQCIWVKVRKKAQR